jgi:hypothetical protein
VAVSIGIERESRAAVPTQAAPTAVDCSGYVVDDAELRMLAAWAIALERNHTRRMS